MTPSELFARDCEELSRLANSADGYQLLQTAAILRRLLVDQSALVDKVNRTFRLKIEFRARELPEFPADIPPPTVSSLQDGIYPELLASEKALPPKLRSPVRSLTRQQLLSHVVMRVHNRPYTMREIVKFVANCEGAVHHGDPREVAQEALREINRGLSLGNAPLVTLSLRGISLVVLTGLVPLWQRVLWQRLTSDANAQVRPAEKDIAWLLFQQAETERDWMKASRLYEAFLGLFFVRRGADYHALLAIIGRLARLLREQGEDPDKYLWVARRLDETATQLLSVVKDGAWRWRALGLIYTDVAAQLARHGRLSEAQETLERILEWQSSDSTWSEWPRLMAEIFAELVAGNTRHRRHEAATDALERLRQVRNDYSEATDPARLLKWSEAVIGNQEGLRAYDEENQGERRVIWPNEVK